MSLRLLVSVDFRSSLFTRNPCRLNRRAIGSRNHGVCKATGELHYYSMFKGAVQAIFQIYFSNL